MAVVSTHLGERKRAELSEKAAGLMEEFDHWRRASAAGGELERHHTQIRAVTRVLALHLATLQEDWSAAASAETVLARAARRERELLALHRIWDFFRSKLALRFVPWFRDYLRIADDLAWSCYEPARQRLAAGDASEPPLVYLNGGASPLTLPRGSSWLAESVAGEELRPDQLEDALRALPVAVIGVPWSAARHLPDALVIGHEVAHDVERDLELTATLDALIARGLDESGACDDRRAAWRCWSGELFADVFGTLAGGPAYVGALMDFISASRSRVEQEWRGNGAWGAYPTRALRVRCCLRALERLGLGDEARILLDRWTADFPSHAMGDYEPDVPHVVDAIVDGGWPQLGGGPLTDVVTFTPAMQESVVDGAALLLRGRLPGTPDVRCTLAAARRAYDADPARYAAMDVARWTVERVEALRRAGTRSAGAAVPALADPLGRDRRAATLLARSLARAHAGDEEGDE